MSASPACTIHHAKTRLKLSLVAALIVAAISITAGSAGMLSSAHAAANEANNEANAEAKNEANAEATSKTAGASAATDTVRAAMFKLIDPARITELMTAKAYPQVQGRINEAAALPALSPYEKFVLDRLRIALGSASGDDAMAMTALEAVIGSNRLTDANQQEFTLALANYHYNAKDYAKAITWFSRYQATGNNSEERAKVRPYLIRAYYFSADFARAKQALLADLETDLQAGRTPAIDNLQLLASSSAQTKDEPTYLLALETLVRFHPSDDAWNDLLNELETMPAYSPHLQLDVLRLRFAASTSMSASHYLDLSELALQAGFPVEAKKVIDAGYLAGKLGTGADAARHKSLRDQANKGAQDDINNIDAGAASAAKANDGTGQINLGYAYVTLGQFDKGIALIQRGLAKGGLKRPDDGKLRLGIGYAMAGYNNEARQTMATLATLATLPSDNGLGKLARYWIFYLDRPVAMAAAVTK